MYPLYKITAICTNMAIMKMLITLIYNSKQLVKLQVYFEEFNYEDIQEVPAYVVGLVIGVCL